MIEDFFAWLKAGRLFVLGHILAALAVQIAYVVLCVFALVLCWVIMGEWPPYVSRWLVAAFWLGHTAALWWYASREYTQAEEHLGGSKFDPERPGDAFEAIWEDIDKRWQWLGPGLATFAIAIFSTFLVL